MREKREEWRPGAISPQAIRKWAKIQVAAEFAGVGVRTFKGMLRDGLRHIRLPSGRVLVEIPDAVDEYYRKFETEDRQVDRIVEDVLREVAR